MLPFTVSNDLLDRPAELRERARIDGTLFFRQLIPKATLEALRRQILAVCQDAGWLDPEAPLESATARPGVRFIEGQPEFFEVYDQIMAMEAFHDMAHEPHLNRALSALFGEPFFAHPRNIARIIFPAATEHTTPAHQDYIHIQGTEETWTSWIPLADCPMSNGSLAVMPMSHRNGLFPVHTALGAGGLGIDTDALPWNWHASDFEQGDVILFQSHLIHKALPNEAKTQMRLSVDFRFQAVSEPVVPSSLNPHFERTTWEQVYAGWKSDQHKFYWKQHELNLVQPDNLYEKLHTT